ncbi:hypothetical protein [Pueribacillus theae]|nr:hypothetical protein [Pueribacillus theae]
MAGQSAVISSSYMSKRREEFSLLDVIKAIEGLMPIFDYSQP